MKNLIIAVIAILVMAPFSVSAAQPCKGAKCDFFPVASTTAKGEAVATSTQTVASSTAAGVSVMKLDKRTEKALKKLDRQIESFQKKLERLEAKRLFLLGQ